MQGLNPPQPKRGWLHKQCAVEFDALEILRAKWEAMWRAKCEQLALKAAEIVRLADENRRLNADLGDARDDTRAAVKARKAEQERNAVLVVDNGQLRLRLEGLERQRDLDRKTIEDLQQELAEAEVTADGIGLAMAELESAAERRVILPGQRADLHDVDQEKRYEDGLGDE